MAGTGLNLKNIFEIKRLWKLGITNRQIAKILGAHRNTVNKYVEQLKRENSNQESTINNPIVLQIQETQKQNEIDWEKVRTEYLSGTPLNIIHEELLETSQVSVKYSGFWKQAQKKISLTEATMVRIFKPGERTEIDYADGIDILDPATGELRQTEFFVGVLCHSRYTFAEFTWTQKSADFLESHVNMFEFFGGTTELLAPDNLKSAVTKAHRYDPVINEAYTRLASHYDLAVVPARVRTPKDKAIVERTIQIFQRYFFMRVRNRTFTSLLELNQCLKIHLEVFNQKEHRIFKRTRHEMYLDEKSSLQALPADRYQVTTHHRAKLSRDCHLVFDQNFYSAPHSLRGQDLDVWAGPKVIEIFCNGERVAFHLRYRTRGKFITDINHYPPAQLAYAEEDMQKIIDRASAVGLETEKLIKNLLDGPQPLKHFRRAQGIVALGWKYSSELLEIASLEANRFGSRNIQYLERVIRSKRGAETKTENEVKPRSFNPFLRGLNNIH